MSAGQILAEALRWAERGFAVFPCWWIDLLPDGKFVCGCWKGGSCDQKPGKHPIAIYRGRTIAPNGKDSATRESGIIKHWWGMQVPLANIAVVLDDTSPAFALDVDRRHHGHASLASLEEQHDVLPQTWTARTGGDGLHIFLRRQPGTPIRHHTHNPQRRAPPPLGEGIDIISDGYVIAAGSRHESGKLYGWIPDHAPHETALADPPGWLVERINARSDNDDGEFAGPAAKTPEEWAALTDTMISEYRDDAATKVIGKLLRAVSLDPAFAYGLAHAWNQTYCRPPLSDDELRRIFRRIARRQAAREIANA